MEEKSLVTLSNNRVILDGAIFAADFHERFDGAIGREISALVREGRDIVVGRINNRKPQSPEEQRRRHYPGRGRTGFTAAGIEGVRTIKNPLLGVIRMRPDLTRPGSRDERAAYIVNAIIESGRRGGSRVSKVRVNIATGRARRRTTWQQGERIRTITPAYGYRTAASHLRKIAPARIEAAVRRELDRAA